MISAIGPYRGTHQRQHCFFWINSCMASANIVVGHALSNMLILYITTSNASTGPAFWLCTLRIADQKEGDTGISLITPAGSAISVGARLFSLFLYELHCAALCYNVTRLSSVCNVIRMLAYCMLQC